MIFTRLKSVEDVVVRMRRKMREWGISMSFLASQLGVSRQYAWQILYYRTQISLRKAREIEKTIDAIIAQQKHMPTFGDRLRAARLSAGLTLKEVAGMIGYTWVGIERWEKNICRPKPGVLWHLSAIYGLSTNQRPPGSGLPDAAPALRLRPEAIMSAPQEVAGVQRERQPVQYSEAV